ncbi:hypothetical protein [Euzebya sp.]|uniref:hypothetical protein n=1 Tax=Euzebya sp. TaxID=1971409 RepID=UPI00351701E1
MDELENIRKRAKHLVRDHRAGLITVPERIRQHAPRFAGMTDLEVLDARFTLRDAQQVLAAELGFPTWEELTAATDLPEARPAPWRGT